VQLERADRRAELPVQLVVRPSALLALERLKPRPAGPTCLLSALQNSSKPPYDAVTSSSHISTLASPAPASRSRSSSGVR
jgi:hypothetical protein